MNRFPPGVILASVAACALAQPAGQKMGASSTVVFGGVSDGKQGVNFVSRAGGFFIDSRHVVSNVLDCCGKSDKGEQVTPIVYWGKDDAGAAKVIWASEDTEIAILELDKPLNHPGVAIAPSKLVQQGQPVYSVQYPKPGDDGSAQVTEGKLTGTATAGDKNVPLYKSNLQMNPNNAGGALFDACGNAIGINLTMKNGEQYAFVIDPLIGALQAAGVQAAVADQPCSASGGGVASGAGAQGGGTRGGGDGGKQTKGKTKEGGEPEPRPQWRLPQGSEWIPVAIVLGLLVLAFRPARKQMAQVVTGCHRLPTPAPYPYPGAPPAPYAAAPYAPPGIAGIPAPPVPISVGTKPVLRGIAGEYAGSAFSLESGTTLGRDPAAANLVFTGEASSVSKRHCSVRWDSGRGLFLLEDHGSTNGTFLASGERLLPNQPRELRPGERFYIGDLRNQFEVTLES
jgi:hypothetical protein